MSDAFDVNEEPDSAKLDRLRLEHVMKVYGLNRDAVDNMMENGGGTLRAAREKSGFTLREVAKEIGTHENYLSRVERGEVKLTKAMKSRHKAAIKQLKGKKK